LAPKSPLSHKISILFSTSVQDQLNLNPYRLHDDKSSLHQLGRLSPHRLNHPTEHLPNNNNNNNNNNNTSNSNSSHSSHSSSKHNNKLRWCQHQHELRLRPHLHPSHPSLSRRSHQTHHRRNQPILQPPTHLADNRPTTTIIIPDSRVRDKVEEVGQEVKVRGDEVVDSKGVGVEERLEEGRDRLGEVRLWRPSLRRR